MGRLFIENEHDYDLEKHYYCKLCKDLKIEIGTESKICPIECETATESCVIFYEILETNIIVPENFIKCEIHPNSNSTFCILDLDAIVPRGYVKEISCIGCLDIIGWYISYHTEYRFLMGLFIMKKSKLN